MTRDHAHRLAADAQSLAKRIGLKKALSAYRVAWTIAHRQGRANDSRDLAYKLAHLSRLFPSHTYRIDWRFYGPTWIPYRDPTTGHIANFPSRDHAEHEAETNDTLAQLQTRVRTHTNDDHEGD
jgi:hypothetical protein